MGFIFNATHWIRLEKKLQAIMDRLVAMVVYNRLYEGGVDEN
jgi:hypothetical protein